MDAAQASESTAKESNDDPGQSNPAKSPTPAAPLAPAPTEEPTFKVWKPTAGAGNPLAHLPDGDLEPTPAELKAAFQAQMRTRESLINAPLRTKALRDTEETARLARWPTTTIRVRFTDRTQLERVFASTERIKAVYVFVRALLAPDVQPVKFVLYQSPPKREFKVSDPAVRDLSLAQLQLAPSSVLLVRFEDDRLNGSNFRAPLRSDILAQAIDLPLPPAFDSSTPAPSAGSKNTIKAAETSGEKKIPKWLKLGKK